MLTQEMRQEFKNYILTLAVDYSVWNYFACFEG